MSDQCKLAEVASFCKRRNVHLRSVSRLHTQIQENSEQDRRISKQAEVKH